MNILCTSKKNELMNSHRRTGNQFKHVGMQLTKGVNAKKRILSYGEYFFPKVSIRPNKRTHQRTDLVHFSINKGGQKKFSKIPTNSM